MEYLVKVIEYLWTTKIYKGKVLTLSKMVHYEKILETGWMPATTLLDEALWKVRIFYEAFQTLYDSQYLLVV